ncbi:hypothetical protein CEXT_589571 [Caerostris extrusa]|uniref:Uncharacterized protein n=1 Tax=Caerostris extrusa TaxID=172846 RepID=A0AAV4QAS8_CAEEX|nr:hypothetical protein CEXT_589571 [Caerostris extrusa]
MESPAQSHLGDELQKEISSQFIAIQGQQLSHLFRAKVDDAVLQRVDQTIFPKRELSKQCFCYLNELSDDKEGTFSSKIPSVPLQLLEQVQEDCFSAAERGVTGGGGFREGGDKRNRRSLTRCSPREINCQSAFEGRDGVI